MKYAMAESATNAIARYTANEKRLRMLITNTASSKRAQHSLVSLEYYSDMIAIGQ